MMRLVSLLLALIAIPARAEEPAPPTSVVVLRGSSAPPTPWYEPPPEPTVTVQTVYVPLYYLPQTYGPLIERRRPLAPFARRNK